MSASLKERSHQDRSLARFERMYREHNRLIYNYLLFRLGNREEAEDATIEAYERALKGLRKYDVQESGQHWLLSIARSVANRHIERRVASQVSSGLTDDEHPDPADPTEAICHRDLAEKILASLNQKEREAVWMHDALGATNKEISEALGCPLGTVLTLIWRARRKALRSLGGDLSGV